MEKRQALIVADLGFGDAGKGSLVDFLCRTNRVAAVVRFNGGAQAGHNVIAPDGRQHIFSQFGSGSFIPGTRTFLSRFMLLDPATLLKEAEHLTWLGLGNMLARLFVDEEALVVTPFQKAANRIRETMREGGRHGSCGMGIGETMADAIAFPFLALRARDLRDAEKMGTKLRNIQELKQQEFGPELALLGRNPYLKDEVALMRDPQAPQKIAEAFRGSALRFAIVPGKYLERLAKEGTLVFEGAQGILLDEWHGFHPYTTWSTTTFANANLLLSEIGYAGPIEKIGALRAYLTRHGAGPFPTENKALTFRLPDAFNGTGRWQGGFRVGWLDTVLLRYAIAVAGGVDTLAVTNLDRFWNIGEPKIGVRYEMAANAVTTEDRRAALFAPAEKPGFVRVEALQPKAEITDLTHQEAITGLLGKITPEYIPAPEDAGQYLWEIERRLQVPVNIVSYGPTANEKYFRPGAVAKKATAPLLENRVWAEAGT